MAKGSIVTKMDSIGNMSALAQLLQSHGRGKDTILAHITPAEARRLKSAGGRGSRNPTTGLLEFGDETPPPATAPDPAPTDTGGGGGQATTTPDTTISSAPVSTASDVSVAPVSAPSTSDSGGYSGIGYTPVQPVSAQLTPYAAGPSTVDLTGSPVTTQTLINPLGDVQAGLTAAQPTTDTTGNKSLYDKTLGALSKDQLLRLGLAGAGGLFGLINNRKAISQINAAQGQEQALAQPYQEEGRALSGAAARGELSPASMQAYRAAQAQLAQRGATTGGVGVAQAATQLEQLRQNLLANQFNQGLQISQIGDKIALGAIQTGLQLDQQLNQANQQFYTSLAAIAAGVPTGTTRTS